MRRFNSRAREGRDQTPSSSSCHTVCFNSRAREGRDAPQHDSLLLPSCFNSRAREGRDNLRVSYFFFAVPFQFTRPRGARLVCAPFFADCNSFQFITRPRGARLRASTRPCESACFNSRAREGRDISDSSPHSSASRFQFTRPRGARLHGQKHNGTWRGFQFTRPRGARHGGDPIYTSATLVSIHAPARGATECVCDE